MPRTLALLPLLLAAAPAFAQANDAEAALKAHVAFLADDSMKGREAGTPEYDIAAAYVASRMLAAGLKPGGDDGGWYQQVPLITYKSADKGSFSVTRGGHTVALVWGEDFLARANPVLTDIAASGEVVFAGYGLVDPATKQDDYKGLDVRGRIVAVLRAAPASLPSEVRAHYGSPDQQVTAALAKGASAVILIESTSRHAIFPFSASVKYWDAQSMTWAWPDGKPHVAVGGAPAFAYLSFAGAEKLFAGSKLKWADVLAADKAGRKIRTGALGVSVSATSKTVLGSAVSSNVVGLLEGSDPALKAETVVLSAHLDHIGVLKTEGPGDKINNGAMDNAVGTATLLEVAQRFRAAGERPKRSILFVAVTAEEKGLIGSEYFAANPTKSAGTMVANVNFDMPVLTWKFEDLVVYGADRTSIGPVVGAVAKAEGLALTPDPAPEQASFVRTDHYSFVKAGIPAVSLEPGPMGPGKAAADEFLEKRYHQPGDDLSQPFDWAAGAKFVKVNYEIIRALADGADRPRWNKGDFFGMLYKGYGAN